MQSETPDRAPSGPDDDTLSQGNKRKRTSERSTRTSQDLEIANAPPMARRTFTTSSPQRGSSRDMTPPESAGSIKYTRTGRVSKATKGQRVHHCDECGKTYTRAEHLRRHQQNHKPGAFPCDVPGCGRSFYREDLLIRHKARHNDPFNPPSRQGSPSSQGSASVDRDRFLPLSRTSTLGQSPLVVQCDTERVEPERSSSRTTIEDRTLRPTKQQLNALPRTGPIPVSLDTAVPCADFPFGWQWNPSSPYSPSGFDSPPNGAFYPLSGPPYFQPQFSRERQESDASHLAYYPYPPTSRSPISAGSSTIHLPLQWGQSAHDPNLHDFGTSFDSQNSYTKGFDLYSEHMTDPQLPLAPFGAQRVITPEDRDFMHEINDLLIPTPSPQSSTADFGLDEASYTNDDRYLGAFWRWIHPFYPVVHRPSFILPSASPLLKAAMLALGAQALPDTSDRRNARIIHERCLKVVKKRSLNSWHSFRTCDMQAMVLIEVYSIFKSRRPPLQLSKMFQDVYQTLANDVSALSGEYTSSMEMASTGFHDEIALSIDARAKQRLLQACYIIDQQHATLFGRQRMSCLSGPGVDLPFPRTQASWDTTNTHHTEPPTHDRVWEALDGTNANVSAVQSQTYDIFQSMLMMACLGDGTNLDDPAYASDRDGGASPVLSRMERSPRVKLAYHTFMLCKDTPIRELLAVTGESWVMAEKISNQAEFTVAQLEARHWAKGGPHSPVKFDFQAGRTAISGAVQHALKIVELHLNHPKTGLLFQEWAVYLASLVLWARAHVTAKKLEQGRRLSVANSVERRPSLHELDQGLPGLIASTTNGDITIEQAKTLLLWTKARIESVDIPHNCGLTNGALDVLGKLAARGGEDGWFGS